MRLQWESAGTEEPGDQNAPSSLVDHGWWSIGPASIPGHWSVELIETNDTGDEVVTGGIDLGTFPDEERAKDAAQAHEDGGRVR